MSWDRAAAAKALAAELGTAVAAAGETVTVFDKPPATLNPPAIVVGRPVNVDFSTVAPGIDTAQLPVACVGPVDGEDRVSELIALVRGAVFDSSLGGAVQVAFATAERNWRQINVAGADLLSAEVIYTIQM
jgi:hypothetical protein